MLAPRSMKSMDLARAAVGLLDAVAGTRSRASIRACAGETLARRASDGPIATRQAPAT